MTIEKLWACLERYDDTRMDGDDRVENLVALLSDTEGMTKAEIDADLREAGYDPGKVGIEIKAAAFEAFAKRLRSDLEVANATIARMAPVVEAAVAWKAAHDEVRDDDAGKLWDALCAAVEKYEGE